MATVNGSVASSSYQGGWRNIVTYTTSQTDTTFSVTITKVAVESVKHYSGDNYIHLEARPEGGAGSESVTFAATGQTSQTITRFPDDQEQMASQEWYWYWRYYWTPNKTFTWNKGSVAATKTVSVGAYLNKWLIETNFTTQTINGATSTASFNVTVPALDASYSYTVSLDLNGGTGAASSLTKWYGENLPLPQPVKEYYSFKGWANSTAPTTVVYQPGVDYQTNAAGSLIAVWEPAIDSAFITNLNAYRADQYGVADDSGTYIKILADWEVKGAKAITVNFTASMDSTPVWSDTATASKSSSEMVKTGTAEWLTSNAASVSNQYTVTVGISADGKTDERSAIVAQAFFTMDVKAGGHGIAFGKPAETDYLFEVDNMDARFGQDLSVGGDLSITGAVSIGEIDYIECRLSANTAAGTTATWTYVDVKLDTEAVKYGNALSLATSGTNRYGVVVAKDGWYRLSGYINVNAASYVGVVIGGDVVSNVIFLQSGYNGAGLGSSVRYLSAGSVIKLRIERTGSTDPTIAGTTLTALTVERIG